MKSPTTEKAQARSALYGTLALAFLYPEQGSAALTVELKYGSLAAS